MKWPDGINGTFELGGAILTWLNVLKLWHHRKVRGVDWRIWIFFTAWGAWNMWYYPWLSQWLSTAGGAVMLLANIVWVTLAIKWRGR